METQLSEPLKAVLIKIATELKKFKWRPDVTANEIDVFQGHLGMFKEHTWQGNEELPDVSVDIIMDMHFEQNEQNQVYFLVYKTDYSLWVDDVGGVDRMESNDVDTPFTEQDFNNVAKFIEVAKKINDQVMQRAVNVSYAYSQESAQEWKDSKERGDWKTDQY